MARQLFGLPLEAEFQLTIDQLFTAPGRGDFRHFSEDLLEQEGLFQDILMKNIDGLTFIANLGVKHILVKGDEIILLMVQDVTIQKKLQRDITAKQIEIRAAYEELLKQNRQLRELDLAKNKFIALTTHELRTPLSAMVASAEILKLGLYDNAEQFKEFINIIYDQGFHLQELVNDILDFSKIQAGKMDYYIQPGDPSELIKGIVENFKSLAEASKLELKYKTAADPLLCYYDDLRLRQAVSNLVNNAIKYNRENGSINVWLEDKPKTVRIFIEDTGLGIPGDKLDSIFNEFETIEQAAQHHKGTGLGLPISKRLIEAMGGTISVKSELGKGSTFWVDIPKDQILPENFYQPRPDQNADLAA